MTTEPNTDRVTVLVLMGGPDAERDVSIMSGRAVAEALARNPRFEVVAFTIDRPGIDELRELPGDIVFPVLHGRWGEGGPLQLLLEDLGRPYVGSGPAASALAMDKLRTKTMLARSGVETPPAIELAPHDPCRLEPPVVLKPVDDGSSVDIRICRDDAAIEAARAALHPRRSRLMAERYIPGRELTVGIVNGRVLPLIEVKPAVEFYDYHAKYERNDTVYIAAPDVPAHVRRRANEIAELAWELLDCRDVARVDYRLDDDDRLWFLELNTMPGFTDHSLVPLAAREAGIEMEQLCISLVMGALDRAITESESAKVAH